MFVTPCHCAILLFCFVDCLFYLHRNGNGVAFTMSTSYRGHGQTTLVRSLERCRWVLWDGDEEIKERCCFLFRVTVSRALQGP